jgi:hypothetical protein
MGMTELEITPRHIQRRFRKLDQFVLVVMFLDSVHGYLQQSVNGKSVDHTVKIICFSCSNG